MLDLEFEVLRIRRIEERIAKEYRNQEMRCPVHLSIGQEIAAVAIASALSKDDHMFSTHRGHAHYLAKGGNLRRFISELYGKQTGCSKGQGGSMHLVDWACGFGGSTSIVGGTIAVGVGLAFANKLKGNDRVVVVCIGDAAIEEGVFHESANFASLHQLRVIFYCENNLFSCFTHIKERQPKRDLKAMARGHGIRSSTFDGNHLNILARKLQSIVANVRKNAKPRFIEVHNYRLVEHCGPNDDDHLGYRDRMVTRYAKKNDPVLKIKMPEAEEQIKIEIDHAFDFAKNSPFPKQDELGKYEYAHIE